MFIFADLFYSFNHILIEFCGGLNAFFRYFLGAKKCTQLFGFNNFFFFSIKIEKLMILGYLIFRGNEAEIFLIFS